MGRHNMIHPLPREVVDYLVLRYPCVSTVEQRTVLT